MTEPDDTSCKSPSLCSLLLIHSLLWGANNAAVTSRNVGGVAPECGGVFLTVSSLWRTGDHGRGIKDSELEINWELACEGSSPWAVPNWVGLFRQDPTKGLNITPAVRIDIADFPSGFYKTNVSFGKPKFPAGWHKEIDDDTPNVAIPGPHCLPFWVASFNNDTLIKSNCLKIQPSWMYDHRRQIEWLPIGSLLIPGTHNSGCFHRTTTMTRRDTFQRYLLTQDRNIWHQLVYGIRYFDFRIGYYPGNNTNNDDNSNKFWINHDLIRVTPLLPLLKDLKHFLETSKGEVVILDIHRFPVGFHNRPSRHRRLITLLQKELGHLVFPIQDYSNGLGPTLNDIWAQDRRLIIAYGEKEYASDYTWLWQPLPQFWGDQQTPSGLKTYLQKVMTAPHRTSGIGTNPLWAAMAELTPTPVDIMFNPSGSLGQMADSVNRNLTTWVRTKWWRLANIVATDFFLGNNLIDVSIKANVFKINTL